MDIWNMTAKHNAPRSEERFELAIHQEDSRSIIIWAQLRPFLQRYVKLNTPLNVQPSDEDLEESIKVALNEGEFFLTQHLIKRHLKGDGPTQLGALAAQRYENGTAAWDRYKTKLTQKIFDHMKELYLWEIIPEGRPDVNHGGVIAKWDISAGSSLIAFDHYVFQPLRKHWWNDFFASQHFQKPE